jgi:hypothetical protein
MEKKQKKPEAAILINLGKYWLEKNRQNRMVNANPYVSANYNMHFGKQSQNNKRVLNDKNNHQYKKKDSDITAAEILRYLQTSDTINVEKIKHRMRQSTSSTPQKENNGEHESVHNDSTSSKTMTDSSQRNGIFL